MVFLFMIYAFPLVHASTCLNNQYSISEYSIVSDTSNLVTGPDVVAETNAVLCYVHPAWTSNIPGASWIWDRFYVSLPQSLQTITVTKTFCIPGIPNTAFLSMAADDFATVSLNGNPGVCGNAYNTFIIVNQQNCDVQRYLRPGKNTLVFEVTNFGVAAAVTGSDNPAGLLYKLSVNALVGQAKTC